jgi:hypothetical protein
VVVETQQVLRYKGKRRAAGNVKGKGWLKMSPAGYEEKGPPTSNDDRY